MDILGYTPAFLYYLLLKPQKSFSYLLKSKEDEHIGIALATAALAFIFNLIAKAIVLNKRLLITFFVEINIIPYIIGFFGNILLITAIWYFIRNFFSQKISSAYLLFKTICFTYFPLVFAPLFAILSIFLNPASPTGIYFFFKIILTGWIVYLQIYVLKINFELKTITAFLLYILPIIALVAFFFIKMWTFFSSLIISLI